MATLHLLANPNAAASCLAAVADSDSLLLIGDGVFATRAIADIARAGVLQSDAEARAVVPPPSQRISDAQFVAWVVAHERSVTWR